LTIRGRVIMLTAVRARRLLFALPAAVAFGVLASVIKGNDAGLRDTVGNLSTPWVVLPLLAGAAVAPRRPGRAALVGIAVTVTALLGFYVSNSLVLALGRHPWLTDLRLAVSGGQRYFAYAVVTGPVFGAAGAMIRRRGALLAATAGLCLLEPLAWAAYDHAHALPVQGGGAYGAEVALGAVLAAVAASRWRTRPPA
jgi:hypothetical protein